jgi:hypothetical protein
MSAYFNTPLATEQKSYSQGLIQQNFLTLKGYLEKDHSIITGLGTHKQVTLPVLGAIPVVVAGECALYSKTADATTQLYLVQGEDALTEVPFWGHRGGNSTLGYALLPGGLKMFWGRSTTVGANAQKQILFPAGTVDARWPGFTAIPTPQVSVIDSIGRSDVGIMVWAQGINNITVATTKTTSGAGNWQTSDFSFLVIGI